MDSSTFNITRLAVEQIIDYPFRNPLLLQEALYAGGPIPLGHGPFTKPITEANKRLALMGDSFFKAILNDRCDEMGMSRALTNAELQRAASNKHLDVVGRKLGLDKYLVLQNGCPGVSKDLMATGVQAILGAVWRDSGKDLKAVEGVAERIGLL
ncbi:uncharacterized protein LTR77_006377 [Saxophila tyrrhenica]|uniref:RNase III domain-containing protein n=1 Tax=Saxophila tyrrhenica TaxID=1690608 RepID=A0AAV9P8I6_9PEZI|nr:hypothetical protein LTR77_006377 [Saxophila tyrrhenica]